MRSIHRFAAMALALFACVSQTASWAAPMTAAESAARETVQGYMAALIKGDTAALSRFITPGFREEHRSLLENPGYAQVLQNSYAGAAFSISGAKETAEGAIEVDTELRLGDGGIMHVRFIVTPLDDGYGIAAEY